jgi:prevent-host-death family protein
MSTIIRPSADLRNHYSEISRECREKRNSVIITVNGRGDTVLLGLNEYNRIQAELELLRLLSDSEDDVKNNRVAPMKNSIQDIRKELLGRS